MITLHLVVSIELYFYFFLDYAMVYIFLNGKSVVITISKSI